MISPVNQWKMVNTGTIYLCVNRCGHCEHFKIPQWELQIFIHSNIFMFLFQMWEVSNQNTSWIICQWMTLGPKMKCWEHPKIRVFFSVNYPGAFHCPALTLNFWTYGTSEIQGPRLQIQLGNCLYVLVHSLAKLSSPYPTQVPWCSIALWEMSTDWTAAPP